MIFLEIIHFFPSQFLKAPYVLGTLALSVYYLEIISPFCHLSYSNSFSPCISLLFLVEFINLIFYGF